MSHPVHKLDTPAEQFPLRGIPQPERVVHVHLKTALEPQKSLCEALASLGPYRQLDWRGCGWAGARLQRQLLELVEEHKPTLLWMQLQTSGVISPGTIVEARKICPEMLVVHWCGDVGRDNGPFKGPATPWLVELAPDLALFTSLDQVDFYRRQGLQGAAYLQIGYETDWYYPIERTHKIYDVSFCGQNYNDASWDTTLPGHEAELRRNAVRMLERSPPVTLGLFGQRWGKGIETIAPPADAVVYRQSRFVLSVSLTSKLVRYSSDRLLRALACGSPVLVKRFEGMGSWGLQDKVNCLVWDSTDHLALLVKQWLGSSKNQSQVVRQIGEAGAKLARLNHTWRDRMFEMAPLLEAAREARS